MSLWQTRTLPFCTIKAREHLISPAQRQQRKKPLLSRLNSHGFFPHKDVYGYQCNYRTQNPAKSFVEKNHLAGQKSCDAISICEWKLDLMAKQIFDKLWGDQQEAVLKACQMVESCLRSSAAQTVKDQENFRQTMEKLEQRMLNLAQMRADGELTKDQYQKLYAQAAKELEALQRQKAQSEEIDEQNQLDLKAIRQGLSKMVDTSSPRISEELIDEFVEVVTPVANHHYRWKISMENLKQGAQRANLLEPENPPVLTFTIDFEAAKQYRRMNKMPAQFRHNNWTDLTVEVFL